MTNILERAKEIVAHGPGVTYPSRAASQRVRDVLQGLVEAAAAQPAPSIGVEQILALKEFLRWAMREGPWEGNDLDGASVQDKAQALGLIVREPYDPDKHGEPNFDFDEIAPGDDWFVFAPGIAE
jgi:hypothetical protein